MPKSIHHTYQPGETKKEYKLNRVEVHPNSHFSFIRIRRAKKMCYFQPISLFLRSDALLVEATFCLCIFES